MPALSEINVCMLTVIFHMLASLFLHVCFLCSQVLIRLLKERTSYDLKLVSDVACHHEAMMGIRS